MRIRLPTFQILMSSLGSMRLTSGTLASKASTRGQQRVSVWSTRYQHVAHEQHPGQQSISKVSARCQRVASMSSWGSTRLARGTLVTCNTKKWRWVQFSLWP